MNLNNLKNLILSLGIVVTTPISGCNVFESPVKRDYTNHLSKILSPAEDVEKKQNITEDGNYFPPYPVEIDYGEVIG